MLTRRALARLSRAAVGVVAAFGAISCADLRSVQVTSAAGRELADYESVIRTFDDTCRLERALQLSTRCASNNVTWSTALGVLVAYSAALDAASSGGTLSNFRHAPSSTGTVAEASGIANQANALGAVVERFIDGSASRASVALAVEQADAPIQGMSDLIAARVKGGREELGRVRCSVECAARAPLAAAVCPEIDPADCNDVSATDAVSFAALAGRLEERDRELEDAAVAIATFASAHHALALHVRELTSEAAYRAVLKELRSPGLVRTAPSSPPAAVDQVHL